LHFIILFIFLGIPPNGMKCSHSEPWDDTLQSPVISHRATTGLNGLERIRYAWAQS